MSKLTITCPKCRADFELTDSLAGPLVAATRAEMQARVDAAESAARTAAMDASIAKADIERDIEFKVSEKAKEIRLQEAAKVQQSMKADFAREQGIAVQAQQEAEELRSKLIVAQKAQAEAVRKERELDERERELNLTIETRISDATSTIRSSAMRESNEANRLKLLEKDTLLESLQKKIEDLNQKLTQGSQQTQGEIQELDLEQQLRARFPHDEISEVGKGVNGADVTQIVNAPSGTRCGLILWESKRTKSFSAGWLPKLREDGRQAGADLLVLVSTVLPGDLTTTFGLVDGIWICKPDAAMTLVMALRMTLLAVHNTKQVQAGMRTKSEEVYQYVTGPQFRHRVEALVEAFTTLQDDLTAEQKAMQRAWAKRAAQIERVMTNTSGMFGDLQGIAGKALPEPEGLKLSAGGGE